MEDFFSSALDEDDYRSHPGGTLHSRMNSTHQHPQHHQSPLPRHFRPLSPALTAISFRSGGGGLFPPGQGGAGGGDTFLERSVSGDARSYQIEPSVVDEVYDVHGDGTVERLGEKAHL